MLAFLMNFSSTSPFSCIYVLCISHIQAHLLMKYCTVILRYYTCAYIQYWKFSGSKHSFVYWKITCVPPAPNTYRIFENAIIFQIIYFFTNLWIRFVFINIFWNCVHCFRTRQQEFMRRRTFLKFGNTFFYSKTVFVCDEHFLNSWIFFWISEYFKKIVFLPSHTLFWIYIFTNSWTLFCRHEPCFLNLEFFLNRWTFKKTLMNIL